MLVFNSLAGPTGILSQSFGATVGAPYLLTFSYGATNAGINESIVVTVTDANGNRLIGTQVYPNAANANARTFTALFVATTSPMTLTFQDESGPSVSRNGFLENVQVAINPPFTRAGEYAGAVVETGSIYGGNVALSRSIAVKMDISSAGQFVYLEQTAPVAWAEGTINDNGSVTFGNAGLYTGTATFQGTDISIDVLSPMNLGGNFDGVGLNEERKFSLHKVSGHVNPAEVLRKDAVAADGGAVNTGDRAILP
jgi:hypothetical protein